MSDDNTEDNEDDDDVENTDCEDTTVSGTSIELTCSLLQSVQTEEPSPAEEPVCHSTYTTKYLQIRRG